MNPFSLTGLDFLVFYVVLAIIVFGCLCIRRASIRSSSSIPGNLRDPYTIALLRGGESEAIRVVVLKLILCKRMRAIGRMLKVEGQGACEGDSGAASDPVEQAVIAVSSQPITGESLLKSSKVSGALTNRLKGLELDGLVPTPRQLDGLKNTVVICYIMLGLIALVRITKACVSGHPFFFLVLGALIVTVPPFIYFMKNMHTSSWVSNTSNSCGSSSSNSSCGGGGCGGGGCGGCGS